MMTSDYIFVKTWTMQKSGTTGQTAYMLPTYDGVGDAETLIASSLACCAANQVDVSKMKKKRYVGQDVLYGVN